MRGHRDLLVWQRAMKLVKDIAQVTAKRLLLEVDETSRMLSGLRDRSNREVS